MSNPIPTLELDALRPLHKEAFAQEAPFTAALAQTMMGGQSALYEFLCDQATPGNEAATVPGHAHGRGTGQGVYVPRHAVAALGRLNPQMTTSLSFVNTSFTRLSLGRPQENGHESEPATIAFLTPRFYLDRAFTELVLRVVMKVEGGGAAEARLGLLIGEAPVAEAFASCEAGAWTPVELRLSVPDTAHSTGLAGLELAIRATEEGGRALIAADDLCFKPMPGTVAHGGLWLMGVVS